MPEIFIPQTQGFTRDNLPQIKASGEFFSFLKSKGIPVIKKTIKCKELKPIQKEFNIDKIKQMLTSDEDVIDKPIISSKDKYILDGHHRWLTILNKNENYTINSFEVQCDIKTLLKLAEESELADYKAIHESFSKKILQESTNQFIVYHGTNANFRKFNLKKTTQKIFWFTDNKQAILDGNVGAQGKGFILKCAVTINNPCGWDEYEKLTLGQIESQGYDGIILPDGEDGNTYIAFNPSQIKILERQKLDEAWDNRKYLAWKRKNVTLRGVRDRYAEDNGGSAMLGQGLYTAFLSNKKMAKIYGDVYFLLNAIPKKPLIVNTLNDWEIWEQKNLYKDYDYDQRKFTAAGKTVKGEMIRLGYDGVIIKGREIVNYIPPDNVKYFQNENQLIQYYEDFVENSLTEDITLDIDKGDTIKTGRFKNHKITVDKIGTDEHGMPTVNGKQITKIRIPKVDPTEDLTEKIINEASFTTIDKYYKKFDQNLYGFIIRDMTTFRTPDAKLKAVAMIEKAKQSILALPKMSVNPSMLMAVQGAQGEVPFAVKLNWVYYLLSGKDKVREMVKNNEKHIEVNTLDLDNI